MNTHSLPLASWHPVLTVANAYQSVHVCQPGHIAFQTLRAIYEESHAKFQLYTGSARDFPAAKRIFVQFSAINLHIC